MAKYESEQLHALYQDSNWITDAEALAVRRDMMLQEEAFMVKTDELAANEGLARTGPWVRFEDVNTSDSRSNIRRGCEGYFFEKLESV